MENYLHQLSKKIVKLTGNELINKRFYQAGTGDTVNVIDELPNFLINRLLHGKKFEILPILKEKEYLKEEFSTGFRKELEIYFEENDLDEEELEDEELREYKDIVRQKMELPPLSDILPNPDLSLKNQENDPTPHHKHGDLRIQVDTPADLYQKMMRKVIKKVTEQKREKGLDIAFLAYGFLQWNRKEGSKQQNFSSPLLLLPVTFSEKKEVHYIEYSGKDFSVNEVLFDFLATQYNLPLPALEQTDTGKVFVDKFMEDFEELLKETKAGWKIKRRMTVGCFKTRGIPAAELRPEGYETEALERFEALFQQSELEKEADRAIYDPDDEQWEKLIPQSLTPLDSSQFSALIDIAEGKNIIMQGPPGTGKSQTIVNILADSIFRQKKVLFLAQKTAALDVVKERLDQLGLTHKYLELHSEHLSKTAIFKKIQAIFHAYNGEEGLDQKRLLQEFKVDEKEFHHNLIEHLKTKEPLQLYAQILAADFNGGDLRNGEIFSTWLSLKRQDSVKHKFQFNVPLNKEDLKKLFQQAEDLNRIIDVTGFDCLTKCENFKRDQPLDPFQKESLNKQVEELEKLLLSLQQGYSSCTMEALRAEHLPDKQHRLNTINSLLLLLEKLNSDYTFSKIPEAKRTAEFRDILENSNFLTRLIFPGVRRVYKQVKSWTVNQYSGGFKKQMERLSDIYDLLLEKERLEEILRGLDETVLNKEFLEAEVGLLSQKLKEFTLLFGKLSESDFFPPDETIRKSRSRCEFFLSNSDKISWLIRYNCIKKELEHCFGAGKLLEKLVGKKREQIGDLCVSSILAGLCSKIFSKHPFLNKVTGERLEEWRQAFEGHDREFKKQYQTLLTRWLFDIEAMNLNAHHAQKVKEKRGTTILQHIAKTPRARLTVRELLSFAGGDMQLWAPCFLMTPSSVADFLSKKMEFDLLVIDEASQMPVEEAAGAILRSKQIVIVGDTQQMPPTSYMVVNANTNGNEESDLSILEKAESSFEHVRCLRYHYRSECESLINFSNHHFYQGNLWSCPEPFRSADFGIKKIECKGTYHSGKHGRSRHPNPIECEAVIQAIRESIYNHPDRSIGVAALNIRQASSIEDRFTEELAQDPKFREYFDRWVNTQEYFFVKNLENVQGDERDTIIISTVYGPNEEGKVLQQFGPLLQKNGEKRINVLVTRAKKQVILVTSLKAVQITSQSKGAQILKSYLAYAASETLPVSDQIEEIPENDFDNFRKKQLHEKLVEDGYDAVLDVGVGNWKIDIGIKDPNDKNSFIAGLEFDDSSYYQARGVKERELHKDGIAKIKGWNIIRLWNIDFLNDQEAAYRELLNKLATL